MVFDGSYEPFEGGASSTDNTRKIVSSFKKVKFYEASKKFESEAQKKTPFWGM